MARNRVFRFLSWNVKGLNDQAKCTTVRSLIRNNKCSVICLQETKLSSTCFSKFWSICGCQFQDFRTLDACGSRGGLLTAWNNALFDFVHCWVGVYSLNVVLKKIVDGKLFLIANVYGPTCAELKPHFFQELRSICDHSSGLWATLGDFNVLLSLQDKNGLPTCISDILNFREVINDIGLIDVPPLNRSYTWSNGRSISTLERLDCAFISIDWSLSFPRSTLKALRGLGQTTAPLFSQLLLLCPTLIFSSSSHIGSAFFSWQRLLPKRGTPSLSQLSPSVASPRKSIVSIMLFKLGA